MASPWQAPADSTQDGWKQRQLHQGLNNLLLSICKHPLTSIGQSWPLLGLEGLQGRNWAGSEGRTSLGWGSPKGKEMIRAGISQTLPTPAPPTHQAQHKPTATQQLTLLLLLAKAQPFPPGWIRRLQITPIYLLKLPRFSTLCLLLQGQLNTTLPCSHQPPHSRALGSTWQTQPYKCHDAFQQHPAAWGISDPLPGCGCSAPHAKQGSSWGKAAQGGKDWCQHPLQALLCYQLSAV